MRRSVESELDRSRVELSSLRLQATVVDDSGKAGFEVEKLLSALKTTVDQMSATSVSNQSVRTFNDMTTKSADDSNLSDRVDGAVKYNISYNTIIYYKISHNKLFGHTMLYHIISY